MPITPLPTAPSRDRPGTFVTEANSFLGALPNLGTEINTVSGQMMSLEASTYSAMQQAQQAAANAAASVNSPSYTGSSVSSLALTVGLKTTIVPSGKNWNPGMILQFWNDATHFMSGTVTSYSGTTMTVLITNVTGTGTYASWQISVLPSITGLTDDHVINALGYTPPKPNGTGASGLWPISITGNAATVTTLNRTQIVTALGYTPPGTAGQGASGTWPISIGGTAAAVPWTGVQGRPTNLADFANTPGFITGSQRAFPKREDGQEFNVRWQGQPGQPTWLLGAIDPNGNDWAVFNPSSFNVNSADTASFASVAGACPWEGIPNRPVNVSQFTNDVNYAGAQWVIDNFFNVCDTVSTVVGYSPTFSGTSITALSLQDLGGRIRLNVSYIQGTGSEGGS